MARQFAEVIKTPGTLFFFSNFAVLPGELGKFSVVPDVSEVSAYSRDAPQPIRRALEFPAVGELRV